MKKSLIGICIILCAILLLLIPQIASHAVQEGLMICTSRILPSLFPFFVVTNLIVRLGYADLLGSMAAPIMERWFHLPGTAASILVTGLLGGYPVGAQTAAALYRSGGIDKASAERALAFCNNAGPAFVFGVAGVGIFQSVTIGAALYLIHLISAVTVGLIMRPKSCPHSSYPQGKTEDCGFLRAFPEAVRQAGETVLRVCVFIVFFQILTGFAQTALASMGKWSIILLGSLELAGGASLLQNASFPAVTKLCLASAFLGWGGFCVHGQTFSILQQAGLRGVSYLMGKAAQMLVSLLLAYALSPLLPLPAACTATNGWLYPASEIAILSLLSVWMFILLKITSGKAAKNRL